MNTEKILSLLLKMIRGEQSQIAFNRSLGFNSNRIHKWESLERKLKWSDFVQLCQYRQIPIREALFQSLGLSENSNLDISSASQVLNLFIENHTNANPTSLSQKLNVHPSTLYRWQTNKTEPDLLTMLNIFNLSPKFIPTLLRELNLADVIPQEVLPGSHPHQENNFFVLNPLQQEEIQQELSALVEKVLAVFKKASISPEQIPAVMMINLSSLTKNDSSAWQESASLGSPESNI